MRRIDVNSFYLFIYLFEKERESAQAGGGAEGEGEEDSLLSMVPDVGLGALSQDPGIVT